ncbi:hypothetical protein SAMN05444266_111180 [Chitinophaga jiangningensis]|uniref:Uncharacterized protein n=1 Tax=Chitinophaga jiangningensis TaxID=1419482 RepID=A0A1M7LVW1_9BACT|nr:hypothetical protein [Chitinophaga jiangningensis]SHM82483.1 hypothetical protein SAMN05444266_111180 [Chitinophaga jiangningensis]
MIKNFLHYVRLFGLVLSSTLPVYGQLKGDHLLGDAGLQADFLFSYSLYFPSGRYELGGDDNAGLGHRSC